MPLSFSRVQTVFSVLFVVVLAPGDAIEVTILFTMEALVVVSMLFAIGVSLMVVSIVVVMVKAFDGGGLRPVSHGITYQDAASSREPLEIWKSKTFKFDWMITIDKIKEYDSNSVHYRIRKKRLMIKPIAFNSTMNKPAWIRTKCCRVPSVPLSRCGHKSRDHESNSTNPFISPL